MSELKRKLFHLPLFAYAALYLAAGREGTLWTLAFLFAVAAVTEALRLRDERLNEWFLRVFKGVYREEESRRPSGILWTLAGVWLTVCLVPHRDIVVAVIAFLALGDGVAALVGKTIGHIRLGNKSLEGSLACFLMCWLVGTLVLHPAFGRPEALWGAAVFTILEALPLPLSDNLWLPVATGYFLTYLRMNG